MAKKTAVIDWCKTCELHTDLVNKINSEVCQRSDCPVKKEVDFYKVIMLPLFKLALILMALIYVYNTTLDFLKELL